MYCRCLSSTDIRAEVADVVQRSYEFSSLAALLALIPLSKTLCTRTFDKLSSGTVTLWEVLKAW